VRRKSQVRAASGALLALSIVGVVRLGFAYLDGPPPAHTGGFGEPSCHRCHFDNPVNAPAGELSLVGLPEIYERRRRYRLTVAVARSGMLVSGFQLAARFAEGDRKGQQAGILSPLDDRAAVRRAQPAALDYVQHTEGGTKPSGTDEARWGLEWTAPADGGAIMFHVAGNAANGDRSEFGDFVYALERTTRPIR